jgi:AraC-like DNA-binding protein
MLITYKEYKPSLPLQPYVENYWYQEFHGAPGEFSPLQVCLPLGMTQIIFHVNGQDCDVWMNGGWHRLPDAFFVGIYKETVTWRTSGRSICFGINLKPENLVQLFKVPASALFNDYTDVANFMNARIRSFADDLLGKENPLELVHIAGNYLESRVRQLRFEESCLHHATRLIRDSKGMITVDALCKNLYITERQLQRNFRDELGTTPKTYTRIIRFRNAYQHLKQKGAENISWTSLSFDHGFADQSHMIRDFKEFSGVNPTLIANARASYFQLSGI